MLINSNSVQMQTVKTTDIFVNYTTPTSTTAQAVLDYYIGLGYKTYNIANTSFSTSTPGLAGITATTSTAILATWITGSPNVGFYNLSTSYFNSTSKDIVLFGGIVTPGTAPTIASTYGYNMDVYFNKFRNHYTSSPAVYNFTMEMIKPNFVNTIFSNNISGITINNAEINNRRNSQITTNNINNVSIKNYQPLTLNNNINALVEYQNVITDIPNNKITFSIGAATSNFCTDGQYIYSGVASTNIIKKIDKVTKTVVGTLDIGQATYEMCTDGKYIYSGSFATNNIKRILISDFTTISTLGIGQATEAICTDGTYVYCGTSTTNNIKRITILDFTTIATLGIAQASDFIIQDGNYVYCGTSATNNLKRILISDFTTIATLGIGQSTTYMCTDGRYLYCGTVATNNLIRVLISDFTTTNTLVLTQSTTALYCDGTYVYTCSQVNTTVLKILISDFSTIYTYNLDSVYYIMISDGEYLYLGNLASNNLTIIYIAYSSINSNFDFNQTLNDTIITNTSNYQYLNADIAVQYETFYSLLGKTTRNFYNVSFRNNAYIPDTLKKFTTNRNWLWRRNDVNYTLGTTSTSPYRIYRLDIKNPTGTASYTPSALWSDENILLRATSTSGIYGLSIGYWLWFNEKLHNTSLNGYTINNNLYYKITHAFQILEFETISDIINITPLTSNGALQGSIKLNNIDNEVVL